MKKIWVLLALLAAAPVAFAAGTLYGEFRRRENIRLSLEQGNVINFLRLMAFNVDRIEELELGAGAGGFFVRDRDNIICAGKIGSRMLRCKNKLGLTTVSMDQSSSRADLAVSGPLGEEFAARERRRLTQPEGDAVSFLRLMKFDVSRVEELEMMEGGQNFVIRDRDNVVCLGDIPTRLLRCKNRIGLTTVTFDGDAD